MSRAPVDISRFMDAARWIEAQRQQPVPVPAGFSAPPTITQPPMPVNPAPNDEELIAQQFQALLAGIRQNGVSPEVEERAQQNYLQGQGQVQPMSPRVSYGFPELRQGGINTPGVDADIAQRESEAYAYDPQHPQHPGLWAGPPGGSQAGIDFANSMREGRQAASRERALGNVTPENIDEATGLLRGYGTSQEQSAREAFRAAQNRDAEVRAATAKPLSPERQQDLADRRMNARRLHLNPNLRAQELMDEENVRQEQQFQSTEAMQYHNQLNAAMAAAAGAAAQAGQPFDSKAFDAARALVPIPKGIGVPAIGDTTPVVEGDDAAVPVFSDSDMMALFPTAATDASGDVNPMDNAWAIGDVIANIPDDQWDVSGDAIIIWLQANHQRGWNAFISNAKPDWSSRRSPIMNKARKRAGFGPMEFASDEDNRTLGKLVREAESGGQGSVLSQSY